MEKEEWFEFRDIPCPVCDSNEPRAIGYRGGEAHQSGEGVKTQIVRCRACSHQYPNPMPFPKIELGELYAEPEDYFQNHDLEEKKEKSLEMVKGFEERLGKKGVFLDVGCGRGELMWAAKEAGWEVYGIDPSEKFIEFARNNLGVEGKAVTLEEAGFASNKFDLVAMGGIIEHLYDPKETLAEIHRILKPDGWLWFDAPNEDGLYMRFGNLYMRLQGKDWVVVMAPTFPPYHVQGFNPLSLRKILEKTCFSLKGIEMCGEVWGQSGAITLKKKIENRFAKFINSVDRFTGGGMYMSVWCRKESD